MKYKVFYPYIHFTIEHPISINDFFEELKLSKKTIHLLKQNKDYTVNKRFVSSSTILLKGDVLTIKAFESDDGMYPPVFDDLDIVYEDEFILIVNKPAFINVYPDDKTKTDSLSNLVSGYYHTQGYNLPVRYIHRLDYETSGLVIYCKCALIQSLLDYQLSVKEIKRYYLAIVEGTISDFKWHSIHKNIGRDRHHNSKMIVCSSGKEATTHYKCLATKNNLSAVECKLESGRKHQIRVHMASIGHPLVGDKLYNKPSPLINRQALHAYELRFIHPITKENMRIVNRLSPEIKKLAQSIDPKL